MTIDGSKIIITGGSSGIGKATAKRLTEMGATVLITGRSKARLEKASAEIGCNWIESDVTKQEDVDKVFQWVNENWGNNLDVLINNAGLGEFASVEETPMESYYRVFGVNVFGPIMMIKKALPIMQTKNKGSIINIASTSSMKGFSKGSAYAASKFALRGFTQSLMEEVRQFNIRVFQVNPSEVTTALGNPERIERREVDFKLGPDQIAQTISAILMLPEKAFVPELSVWATNPRN
jgi:3-oxoacyl-[acyl-carrier protein] reductase